VSDYVVDLTGHTREDLAAADPFPAVAERFHDWCLKKSGVNRLAKLRLAAWGNYFDVNVLRAEYAAWGLPYPFSGTAIDVKTAALLWCAASGRRTDSLSVHKCAEAMNIVPLGPYHRADVDADATAQIFQRAVGDLAGGVWVGRQYVAVRPEGS
jgi:DNA polymerase III alpha subunit (gram-positive type)